MKSSYTLLFSVLVEHDYFNKSACTCLSINPGGATQQIFDRYGIKCIQEHNEHKFYIKSVASIDDYLDHITKVSHQTGFEFEMLPQISNFNIITELPVDWNGTITYHTKDPSNVSKPDSITLAANFDSTTESIACARLIIYFEDLLKQLGTSNGANFLIKYESRATRWNYYIINRNAVSLDNPKISGRDDVAFEGPTNTTLENGQEALKFTTGDQFLPMSETPVYKFKLINENSNAAKTLNRPSGKLIMDGLPNPSPQRISIEKNAEKSIASSDMYVYV